MPDYSGKKKKHTLRIEIRVTHKGRIVQNSKPYPGSAHDFTIFKEGELPPSGTRIFVDSGHQGIADVHPASEFPYKSTKNKTLGEEEYNTALSRFRLRVEHIFGDLKTFKILSENYRNKRKRYHLKFKIIAGIVNLKNGFAPI